MHTFSLFSVPPPSLSASPPHFVCSGDGTGFNPALMMKSSYFKVLEFCNLFSAKEFLLAYLV